MRKCLLLLPTAYNNGQPVEPAKLKNALGRIDNLIGGHTVDGTCEGVYRMEMGQWPMMFASKWWRFAKNQPFPVCGNCDRFAVDFGQESIYFERTRPRLNTSGQSSTT